GIASAGCRGCLHAFGLARDMPGMKIHITGVRELVSRYGKWLELVKEVPYVLPRHCSTAWPHQLHIRHRELWGELQGGDKGMTNPWFRRLRRTRTLGVLLGSAVVLGALPA